MGYDGWFFIPDHDTLDAKAVRMADGCAITAFYKNGALIHEFNPPIEITAGETFSISPRGDIVKGSRRPAWRDRIRAFFRRH